MYKDLSLKEKAKVLLYGGKLGLTSVEDIAKLYDEAVEHKFLGDTNSQMNNSSGVLKWNEELLDFAYSVPEVTVAYDLPKRNEDKSGFDKYVQSITNSYINGNINTNDVNKLPWLYRNAIIGLSNLSKGLEMTKSYNQKVREEFRELSNIPNKKKIKRSWLKTVYGDNRDYNDIPAAIDNIAEAEKYNTEVLKKEKQLDNWLSSNAGKLLNAYIPFFDPFKGDMTDMPSQAYRYYLRHFKNDDEYISGNGTDIVSLNDNVIRLTPTSNQSTALFNEFVERANPSVRKASDYKNNNAGTFGDSNIPIQNISLYQGIENGVFKVAPIEQFNDNTDVYPVRNIRKAFSAPIKNIDVSFDVNPTYPNSAGINYRTRLEYKKISNDYKTTFNEIALDNIDNLIEEAELIKDTKLVDKLQDFKRTGKYKSFYGLEYDLSDLPSYSNISDKAFSGTKSLNKQYFEQIDNELILLDSIFQEKQKQYPSLFRDDFGTYTWYCNNIKDKLGKYNVTDVNDSTYNISNLNAAILDNKMVLGNPNGGVFIGKFLDISKPLLDSLNAYLLKNPSWLARPDLGSFDQYRLDSPSLGSYLRQYFEHPDQNDPNVFVVGTTQPNKLWSNSYAKGGPIVSPYGQWKYPGRDTIIPSNNITMDNVNYPVLGVSDTGDIKIMMPWNDYKFRGSVVYEHPLIDNQFQLGGNTKPTFDLWYPTVPNQKNDTSSYDLRRAYNTLPFDEMEKFRTINNYHLPSVAYDEKTDTYTFLKRNGHPTLNYELDWYNSGNPDALEFRERYKLDTLSLPWRYIPNIFLTGGLVKKPEPIYNENGQVIGRRYVNKDNSKIIDSVVPQGRVNFQEFLKAKGKKARATNFEDLELFLDSLIARGYNEPLRLAFLATSYNEMDNKGAASKGIGGNGYMGFNTIRMPLNLLNDSSKQIQYILNDTEKLTPDNWTDGGSGGPYIKNLTDAFNKFWNETNPNTATLVLNKTNIRPAKLSDWYLRASDADLMKQYMEYPELPKEEEQKQKKSNKLLDSFVDFILSGGLQNTPSYADGGNLFKKGGIYIKPENRGKFTALKKRTGHSASWFKAHGTPALKKMATFALNAKKWHHKHDDGGHLFLENGQMFKRPQDDLTGRNILTSPILPPKSYYEQFTIPELEPKKPQPLQPLKGTYRNKYSELIPMSDGTYVNNPINKGLQLDWRTHALEFAPFLAIGAGPAMGSTTAWLASKPALYNLGRMTIGSEIGGRSVDLASKAFTGNTWGLNVGNVVEGISGWNPNNTMVGLFVTDLTNPGYAGKEGLASLAGLFTRFGKRKPKLSAIPEYVTNKDYSTWTDDMWTAAQDAAIARGDMAEALRLRDLHFKVNAPNTQLSGSYYRSERGDKLWNVFDMSRAGTNGSRIGTGIYFFNDANAVKNYGDDIRRFYVNSNKVVEDIPGPKLFGMPESTISKFKNHKVPALRKAAENIEGADVVHGIDESWGIPLDEWVVKNPNQIKLADAVTYDDNGIRIPLSLRDNFKFNDIRYGLIPLGGIGLYGLQNKVNKQYN